MEKQLISQLLTLLFTSLVTLAMAQPVHDIYFKTAGIIGTGNVDSMKLFFEQLQTLVKSEDNQRKFIGKAPFGFSGNQSPNQSIYQIFGGIKLERGKYPSEFEIRTDFNLGINNGKVQENVSNIFMAFDYHPDRGAKDALAVEHFAFLGRFSNAFLGVEQRYELGLGSINAIWSKSLTSAAVPKEASLSKAKYRHATTTVQTTVGTTTMTTTTSATHAITHINTVLGATKELKSTDIDALNNERKNLIQTIRKLHAKMRVGILYGTFVEMENINFKDTVDFIDNMGAKQRMQLSYDFQPTVKLRWELRPFIDLRPTEKLKFSIRPFIKLPMPWEWEDEVKYVDAANNINLSNKRFDFRVDCDAAVSYTFGDVNGTDSKFSMSLSYNLYYDNAPQRIYFKDKFNAEGVNENLLFSAAKLNQIYKLDASISF